MQEQRKKVIAGTIRDIRNVLANGISVATMNLAKLELIKLAGQKELFSYADFPVPVDGRMERTYLLHEDEAGEYALYVNAGTAGQYYRPHNHGDSWAIIAAVDGSEKHGFYSVNPAANNAGQAPLIEKGEYVLSPGDAVSMLPDGIHSIHAVTDKPLLHLHLYGLGFAKQNTRMEYDLETNTSYRFKLDDFKHIEDYR